MSPRSGARRGTRARARRGRRARRLGMLLAAVAVTAGVVYVGYRGQTPQQTGSSASPSPSASSPTPRIDLSGLPIKREEFCDRLDRGDVALAIGGPVASTYHYGNGDRRRLTPGVTDVSHEYNCTFRAANGTQARAWVFAEPVSKRIATSIARDNRRQPRCRELGGTPPTFGSPAAATRCDLRRPERTAVTLSGLFGDAWFSCQVTAPAPTSPVETTRRTEQWCVRVATTLGARP